MALTCPTCGREVARDMRFCPHDGATVTGDTVALRASSILAVTPAPPPPPDPGDPFVGRVLDRRYRVRAPLGKGAVGAVYEAEHIEMKKPVAVKVLFAAYAKTDEFRKRFEREARSASRLNHPGCVSVLDFGRDNGTPYLVMELVKGELLLDRIEKGKIPPREALMIAKGVLAALRHAHGLSIVHRDVKPGNIMITSVGETAPLVKLLDFGLAKSTAEDSPDVQQPLTAMGVVFGTPGYLSPEQAAGREADARSDLYAMGVVLFEMVCGCLPFVRAEAADVVRDHLLTPPPSPRKFTPELSAELEAAILKALAKDPAKRFQTAEELQAALAACPESGTAGLPEPAAPAPAAPRPRMPIPRRVWIGAAAAAAAVGLLAVLIAVLRSPPQPRKALPVIAAPPVAAPPSPSARRRLQLAESYQQKLWCADAIEELERALRDEPALRANPDVTRIAIPCLRAKTQAKTVQFLVNEVGPDARGELEAALAAGLKPDVREGAQKALDRLAGR